MKLMTKIKAGAIQYVLVISVIIMIVLFAFISLVFLQNRIKLKSEVYKETIHSSYLGFDYVSKKQIPYDTPTEIRFSDFDEEKTIITKKHWGVFDLAIIRSTLKNETFQKIGLLGSFNDNRKALYLQENNQPLLVVGNTKITGDVVLPRKGVTTGNISGVSYYGDALIYGNIKTNASTLPSINNLNYITQITDDFPLDELKEIDLNDGLQLQNSFEKETLGFVTDVPLDMRNMSLKGNIVIISRVQIRVFPSAKLEDVILVAPKVILEPGVDGNCQIFAKEKIWIKEQVSLNYPSSLVVIDDRKLKGKDREVKIEIEKNTQIKGAVLYYNKNKESDYTTQVVLDEGAKVVGEVYCNKNFELAGSVDGFVYTDNFIANQAGGIYINYIYNGQISAKAIPEQYNGLFVETDQIKVVKWLE